MKIQKISRDCKIIKKERIYRESGNASADEAQVGDVVTLRLEWDGHAYPGCFFQLQPQNGYLRRPISLCGCGAGYIDLAIRVAGEGTAEIVSRPVGATIACFGPLGRGFEMPDDASSPLPQGDPFAVDVLGDGASLRRDAAVTTVTAVRRYLIVGGGIGVAPLLPLAEHLKRRPDAVFDFVVGFRGRPYLEADATHVCAEDPAVDLSRYANVHHGNVGPVVESLLRRHPAGTPEAYADVFVCGPRRMLEALAKLLTDHGYDPQLLTEAHMGCGVGACLVCTTEVRSERKYARVCADGPMFRASELSWESERQPDGQSDAAGTISVDSCSCAFPSVLNAASDSCSERGDAVSCSCASSSVWNASSSCAPVSVSNAAESSSPASRREYFAGSENSDDALAVTLGTLHLKSLLTMASGTFGFGREYDDFFDIGILGAVSVKGLTRNPKAGNPGRRAVEVDAGMINSVGLQNPGMEHFLEREVSFLRRKNVAVIANINGESVSDMVWMAERADSFVDAVELNISCPNVSAGGMSFGTDPKMTAEIVRAVRKVTTAPLIVKLTPNVTDIVAIAKTCEEEGADILSMINTVTGLAVDWRTGEKPLMRGFGGMSGAAVKPVALRCIDAVSSKVRIPIIGMGGISSAKDVLEFLRAGASAVAIGTAIFRDPLLPLNIDADLRRILKQEGRLHISDFYKKSK